MSAAVLHRFEKLAQVREPRARSVLIRSISDEYVKHLANQSNDDDRAVNQAASQLFSSIVLDLYDQIDTSVRRDIIILLARTEYISSSLAARFAQEPDAHVRPLFEHSPKLNTDILLEAVRTRDEAVLMSIAKRKQVPEDLVDAMLARAFAPVNGQLLRNPGARFSTNALLVCAIACQSSLEFQALVADRCLKDELFFANLHKQIRGGCPFLPNRFSRAILELELDAYIKTIGEIEQNGNLELDGEFLTREEVSVQVNIGTLTFDSLLNSLIEGERMKDIIWFLNREPNISMKSMKRLLLAENLAGLSRLLCQQGVKTKTYEALLNLRDKWYKLPPRNHFHELHSYKVMLRRYKEQKNARQVMLG